MVTTKTKVEVSDFISAAREKGRTLGFVPTMGALHQGHISLISKALSQNDVVVCSIFINPTQFTNPQDLERYPRMPEADASLLREKGCDCLFLPTIDQLYEPDEVLLQIDFEKLETTMEGKFRPGHFKGVATIVDKLFRIINPDRAYFGEKDFQQLTIIRRMAEILKYPTKIIGCPTLREPDGLAMSSRNLLLTEEQRKAAPLIYQVLNEAQHKFNSLPVSRVTSWVIETINNHPLLKVEYFQIVDSLTLLDINDNHNLKEARGCIAVLTDGPRLIDNIRYTFN